MADGEGDWASMALDLGYFDQAHFIKAFKAVVGRSPADYALRASATRRVGRVRLVEPGDRDRAADDRPGRGAGAAPLLALAQVGVELEQEVDARAVEVGRRREVDHQREAAVGQHAAVAQRGPVGASTSPRTTATATSPCCSADTRRARSWRSPPERELEHDLGAALVAGCRRSPSARSSGASRVPGSCPAAGASARSRGRRRGTRRARTSPRGRRPRPAGRRARRRWRTPPGRPR